MNIKELKAKILAANTAYRSGDSIISDQEFDDLCEEYQKLVTADEYEEFRNSLHEVKGKVKHPYIMGSLDKFKYEEPEKIKQFILDHCNGGINISAKVDGISCRLHYEDGKLTSASTRGDGYFGEDLTDKIQYVKGVPKILGNGKSGDRVRSIDIRGELVILKDDFAKMTGFANARNACAGIMNRKDWKAEDISKVTFVAYTILGKEFCKEEQFALLSAWGGFKVAWNINYSSKYYYYDRKLEPADELFALVSQDFEYDVDGLVICGNLYKNEDKYRPDECIAFKTNQLIATTRVNDVSFDGPSKDGYFIPVAELEPVELGGATISRAHLHNLNYIRQKDLKYGSIVKIVKSGDIIPKVICVVDNPKDCLPISFPKECPCCSSKLVQDEDDLNLKCTNSSCRDQVLKRITNFIKHLKVKGISEATLDNFKIYSFEDLIKFRPNAKYKTEVKLFNELEAKVFTKSKAALLAAMNFEGLAEKSISKIVDFYGFDNIIAGNYNGYPDGIGELTLQKFKDDIRENLAIVDMFINDSRYNCLETTRSNVAAIQRIGSVCFTGKLNTMTRSQASKLAEDNGYEVKDGVNKGLTYLVTNDTESGSSKNKKAKQLGTKIISEKEFLELCANVQTNVMDM